MVLKGKTKLKTTMHWVEFISTEVTIIVLNVLLHKEHIDIRKYDLLLEKSIQLIHMICR